ncbi:hypothetical protein BAE44_0011619, partial [Dichanthelium oligosanthes]
LLPTARGGGERAAVGAAEAGTGAAAAVGAVSYTHLDVYKRQDPEAAVGRRGRGSRGGRARRRAGGGVQHVGRRHGAFAGAGRRTTTDRGGAAGARTGAAEVLAARKASCFAARLAASRRPGALTCVLEVFRRHGVHVLAATVTSNGGEATVMVTTAAVAPTIVEGIKADISSSIA